MEKIIRIDDHSGLVLEGGGMRGVFTCGVLDSFMDRGIRFPYTIGVSAGACNGLSYMSGQQRACQVQQYRLAGKIQLHRIEVSVEEAEYHGFRLVGSRSFRNTYFPTTTRHTFIVPNVCDGNYQLRDGRSELF